MYESKLSECCDKNGNNRNGNKFDEQNNRDGKKHNKDGFEENLAGTQAAILNQNNPNPFTKETEITCFIPDKTKDVAIYIYNMQGKQVKYIPVFEKGKTKVNILDKELYPGMFFYSLIIDGKEIDTKKMILTK